MVPDPKQPAESPRAPPLGADLHPRTIGWLGTTALAMGGSNQSLFLLAALMGGQGAIPGQGSTAIPLLILGLLLSWAAAPGWTELILMWPNRVGGIAAACSEAFRPRNPLLAALAGSCYWWGRVPVCGLTALLSAAAIQQWFAPLISVKWLASGIVAFFVLVNLCGIRWVVRLAVPIAVIAAGLAFVSALAPSFAGKVNWVRAATFHLATPFAGAFGTLTGVMAGVYLIGFAAPAFEAAACHVGETIDPQRNVPRAMVASAAMAAVYFVILPLIWLGMFGPARLTGDLAVALGPTFAPLFGSAAKAVAIGFMVFNMFPGIVQPLAGASRTLSQLAQDGLLPRSLGRRNRADAPWAATVFTAAMAIVLVWLGDPVWLLAAASFPYLIGICMASVAVWLLRRNAPDLPRLYRARPGLIELGLAAALVWFVAAIFGFAQYGIGAVIIGLGFAYSGTVLFAWRKFADRRRAGLPGMKRTLHLTLTGAMLLVLALDAAGYQLAVSRLPATDRRLVAGLEDIFVVVAMLTIIVGLVVPGRIAHAVVEVADATKRLVSGTLLDFTQAMEALGEGDLAVAKVELDFVPLAVGSHDEIEDMASSFNELQREVRRSALGLARARAGLGLARQQLLDSNRELGQRVEENGRLIGDLTQARDAAQAASVAKDRFVAKMSHEIRTPMNGILTTIDLLSNSELTPAQRQLVSIIERSGETLLALANEVLGYARVNSGKIILDRVEFDLIELVRNRFDETAMQGADHPIDVRLALPTDRSALRVVSDPLQLTLVLRNVIANALKFTKQGLVDVNLRVLGETADSITAEFCVTDTGIGISAEFKPRIFEPFAQENESTTRTIEGTGLGLSIVKEIVDSLGGEISIDSSVGQGTAVRINWAMAKAPPEDQTLACEDAAPSRPDPDRQADHEQRILVAEDNPINQEVIAASLMRLGHGFRIVDNGAAALAAIDEEDFSLVLMDCRMPKMDGYEAARAIRANEERKPGRRVPIVAVSANAAQADRDLCRTSGMDDHIAKPFTLAELKAKLEKFVPTAQQPIADGASGKVVTNDPGAPIYQLLDADMLRAFQDLQMPDQPSIINELIDSFFRTAPQQLHLIGSLINAGDFKGSRIAAHGMKSASAAIGLISLSGAFKRIEVCVAEGDCDEAILAVQKTGSVLNKSLHELSIFRAHFGRPEARDMSGAKS